MASSNLGSLSVYLTANTSNFQRGMTNAEKTLHQLKNTFLKISGAIGGAYFLKSSIAAFAEQELMDVQLAKSITLVGGNVKKLLPEFQAFASEIQRVTTIGDEATLGTMAYGLNIGITTDKIKETTKAAIGLSRKLKIDVNSALKMIALAQQGNTSRLTRYGVVIDETLSKQGKFNAVLKLGAEAFSLAEGEADTLSGRTTQLSNAWGDFKENIGGVIANLLGFKDTTTALRDILTGINTAMGGWIEKAKEWNVYLKIFFTWFGSGFATAWETAQYFFGAIQQILANILGDVGVSFEWLKDTAMSLLVGLIKGVQNFAVSLWTNIEFGVQTAFNVFVAFFQDVGKNFDNLGDSIVNFMTGDGWNFSIVSDNMAEAFKRGTEDSKNIVKDSDFGFSDLQKSFNNILKPDFQGMTEGVTSLSELLDSFEYIENQKNKLIEEQMKKLPGYVAPVPVKPPRKPGKINGMDENFYRDSNAIRGREQDDALGVSKAARDKTQEESKKQTEVLNGILVAINSQSRYLRQGAINPLNIELGAI